MLIGGDLVEGAKGDWLDSISPATEEIIGRVPSADKQDVDRAVDAAKAAFESWRALDVSVRGRYLRDVAAALRGDAAAILETEVRDTGNTIRKMKDDVERAARMIEYYAGLGLELKGETVPASPGNIHLSLREPYGVVGRIVPFNHPISFAASRMAAPLTAGNTIVVKPSEQSPLSATLLARICQNALPAGVVNIVTGLGASAGDALVRHPDVKRLAFIGSVRTGLAIQRSAAEVAVKHVSLELGGKNPMIIFPDADVDKALAAAVAGMNFAWQGQSCGSVSRVFVHTSLYDRAVETIGNQVGALRVGDPLSEASDMGPINSAAQYEKVLSYIASAKDEGARLVTGGQRPDGPEFERGFWVRPTVFADVTPEMKIFREEIFGPVMSVIPWSDADELIAMANSVEYGLTAAIWTNDLNSAFQTAQRVRSGYVWINGVSTHYLGCGFGGFKNSGTGREEGIAELLSYTESKFVHLHLPGDAG